MFHCILIYFFTKILKFYKKNIIFELLLFNLIKIKFLFMKKFPVVIEKCNQTGMFVGYVPGFRGAHSQAISIDDLKENLKNVIKMLLDDGTPVFEGEFVGMENLVLT